METHGIKWGRVKETHGIELGKGEGDTWDQMGIDGQWCRVKETHGIEL